MADIIDLHQSEPVADIFYQGVRDMLDAVYSEMTYAEIVGTLRLIQAEVEVDYLGFMEE